MCCTSIVLQDADHDDDAVLLLWSLLTVISHIECMTVVRLTGYITVTDGLDIRDVWASVMPAVLCTV